MTRKIGKKEFMILGKLLVKNRPEIAEALLPAIEHSGNEKDRSLIPDYFNAFCRVRLSDITDIDCRLNRMQKSRERKIFIAIIFQLYAKEVFHQAPANALLPHGLSKELVNLLGLTKGGVSQFIRQVLYDYRNYEQFRFEVEQVLSSLKTLTHGETKIIQG